MTPMINYWLKIKHNTKNSNTIAKYNASHSLTRQVYNLFQEPVEEPPLGFSIAEEKNQTVLKTKQVKKLAAPSAPSNLYLIAVS